MLRAKKTAYGYEIEIGKTFGLYKTVWNDTRYDANEPHEPKLKKKAIMTTIIAAVIWAIIAYVILGGVITRADIEGWTQGLGRN